MRETLHRQVEVFLTSRLTDGTGENVTVLQKKMTDQWGNLGDENKVERKN